CGIKKALETKNIVVSEEILTKENNRPIQVTTIPFQAKDGQWLVAEVNADISERKKVEEQLKKYRDHLKDLVRKRTSHLMAEITEHSKTENEREKLTKELIRSNKKLKQLALKDSHTGLYNHRYLEEAIDAELYRARRYTHPLSVIMLDIDYFKSINDVYGHQFGDLILKQFAKLLKKMVRRYDIIIRFGGEEFIIISPGTAGSTALLLGRRILDSINLYNFGNKKHTVKLKLSIAVSSYPENDVVKGMDLVDLADQILNKVKEYGGNRVYTATDIKVKAPLSLKQEAENTDVKVLKTKIERLHKRANQSLIEAVFAFAKTIELKDHYTGEHGERTVYYATEVAKNMGLPAEEVERVREAAILHDLGKIGISEKILLKKSSLTKGEFTLIKKHPQIGVDIIRPIQFLHSIIPLIFYHHERWDGKGYPVGLKGKEIPIGARIIALADAFQALSSDRPYRKGYSIAEALKIIESGSGSQFDPAVVKTFLGVMQKYKNRKSDDIGPRKTSYA
ncbi:MAG: diguanylate cyclase, partial [Candidatus Omnitrophica bacterium]|nr:diguanylate cyclase [Candidatus Omnitrophota bacterium]